MRDRYRTFEAAAEVSRVLMVIDRLGRGGAERQFALLASSLPPRWEARVIALGGGPFVDALTCGGIATLVAQRRCRLDLSPIAVIHSAVRAWRPDVLHTWGWMSTASAIVVGRLLGVPVVDSSVRTGGVSSRHRVVTRLVAGRADCVVANSTSGLRAWGMASPKGRVIANGFDLERLRGLACGVKRQRRFRVIMAARMELAKDFDAYCKAARALHIAEPGQWLFMTLGDGSQRVRLQQENRDLITAGALQFLSPVSDVTPWVACADAGVLLTDPTVAKEGCSNSIMEYMACGLPVVCSAGGGNPDLVDSGRTGFVLQTNTVADLVPALQQLRTQPRLRYDMGCSGAQRIRDNFSASNMAQSYARVYESLLVQRMNARNS